MTLDQYRSFVPDALVCADDRSFVRSGILHSARGWHIRACRGSLLKKDASNSQFPGEYLHTAASSRLLFPPRSVKNSDFGASQKMGVHLTRETPEISPRLGRPESISI